MLKDKNFIIIILTLIICILVILGMILHSKHIADLKNYSEYFKPIVSHWRDKYNREHTKVLGLSKPDTIYRDVIKYVKVKPEHVVYYKEKTVLDTIVKKKRYSIS